MTDVLSQGEVDALIEAYRAVGVKDSGPKSAEKRVRLYDFGRPDKFSKEHLRALNGIHIKHGAAFAAALGTMLRTSAQVDLLALEQLTYREYCNSVPEGTLFVEVGLEPLTPTAIFEFNPLFVAACVDTMAGGTSISKTVSTHITDIEKAIMQPVVSLALRKYAEAWASCVSFEPRIVSATTEATSRQVFLASEAVMVCGYEVTMSEGVSMMSICMPASAIEAVLPALAVGRKLNAPSRRLDKVDDTLMKSFEEVEVECRAVLGKTRLMLSEVVDLEVGDLITLPTKADGESEIWVENVPAFAGVLGVSGRNLAVRISRCTSDLDAVEFGLRMAA